jgi:hypothetical protein
MVKVINQKRREYLKIGVCTAGRRTRKWRTGVPYVFDRAALMA